MGDIKAMDAVSERWNVRFVGHPDLHGHGDGTQILNSARYAHKMQIAGDSLIQNQERPRIPPSSRDTFGSTE